MNYLEGEEFEEVMRKYWKNNKARIFLENSSGFVVINYTRPFEKFYPSLAEIWKDHPLVLHQRTAPFYKKRVGYTSPMIFDILEEQFKARDEPENPALDFLRKLDDLEFPHLRGLKGLVH